MATNTNYPEQDGNKKLTDDQRLNIFVAGVTKPVLATISRKMGQHWRKFYNHHPNTFMERGYRYAYKDLLEIIKEVKGKP